ncbi:MAG: CoA transferase [Deltaproteobacteria bacterium]|nr:CoA transferase [Deltaproteobacteria bacterium]
MTERALEGVKVLDLSQGISGSYCGKLFGAFGAEVIKIEPPGAGDPARSIGPFLNDRPHPETSAVFLYLNTNKRGITLNIEAGSGAKILKDLAAKSDILIENYSPSYLPGLGLGFDVLSKINPNLIMASVSDFGQTGPYRDYKGGRLVANALGGYTYINGDPGREPLAGGGEQPAYQSGINAYNGAMAALLCREKTGQGQHIDVSAMECMASIHQFNVNRYVYAGRIQERVGNRYVWAHPITIYPCQDGYVSICPSAEAQTESMLILMGMEHLLEDERFQTGFHRLVNFEAFDEIVKPWFMERTRREIIFTCQEWRVPATFVNSVSDLLEDEQLNARKFWAEIDHPFAGKLPYASAPFIMSETPAQVERAPLLGEHNEEIYTDYLGLTKEELVRLRQNGVI